MDKTTNALIRIEEMRQLEDREKCKTAKVLPLKNSVSIANDEIITVTTKLTTLD